MVVVGVFGANGFIGRHLVAGLLAREYKIVCFVRHIPLDFQERFGGRAEIRVIDFHDDIETQKNLFGITHVVQLINSSNAAIANSRVVSDLRSNVIPHVQFINSCILAEVESFTFLSSGGTVYGRPKFLPITEDHPTSPLNSYGLTKLVTEKYLKMLCENQRMGFNILRVANPYGPGQTGIGGQGLIGTILQRARRAQPLTIFGNGLNERDYLYIEDTVDAIIRTIECSPINDVVNIGSGQGRSINQVVEAVEEALGQPVAREYVADRATDAASNVLDARKAERLLGWKTTTPFKEGVAKTVEWYLEQGG